MLSSFCRLGLSLKQINRKVTSGSKGQAVERKEERRAHKKQRCPRKVSRPNVSFNWCLPIFILNTDLTNSYYFFTEVCITAGLTRNMIMKMKFLIVMQNPENNQVKILEEYKIKKQGFCYSQGQDFNKGRGLSLPIYYAFNSGYFIKCFPF